MNIGDYLRCAASDSDMLIDDASLERLALALDIEVLYLADEALASLRRGEDVPELDPDPEPLPADPYGALARARACPATLCWEPDVVLPSGHVRPHVQQHSWPRTLCPASSRVAVGRASDERVRSADG